MSGNRLTLVTGATSGIGLELARMHAIHSGDLVLVARSEAVLMSLQREWEHMYKVRVYPVAPDLSLPGAVGLLAQRLIELDLQPEYVINNAGLGGLGEFAGQSHEQINRQMVVNMVALTQITREFLPAMIAAKHGAILQVASLASFMPGPLQAVYYASKAYVLSFAEALRLELRTSGVTVTTLCPGPTESNFLAAAGGPSANMFQAQSARQVAEYGYQAMLAGRSIAIPDRNLAWQLKFIPRRLLLRITHRQNLELIDRARAEAGVTNPG